MRRTVLGLALIALAVAGCGKTNPEPRAAPHATTTTVSYDGRLHRTYKTAEYDASSTSMGSWRMDPAPADQTLTATPAQILTALTTRDSFKVWMAEGKTARIWFGLFSGNAPNPNAPDGRLTGSHRIEAVPSWLVVVDDIRSVGSQSNEPVTGYALTVVADAADAAPIAGLEISGGEAPPIS